MKYLIILTLILAGCGGGEASQQDKDEADQAVNDVRIHPPVNCALTPEACK
jgi:hypothetical protein